MIVNKLPVTLIQARSTAPQVLAYCRSIRLNSNSSDGVKSGPRKLPDKPDPNTPLGRLDRQPKKDDVNLKVEAPQSTNDVYAPFPDGVNPATGERGGPLGPEPTRYGDWERKGRVTDF